MTAKTNATTFTKEMAWCNFTYSAEISRAYSYITSASTLTLKQFAVAEVINDFARRHDVNDVGSFVLVLALRLERVGDLGAAAAIRSHSYRSRVGGLLT